MFGNSIIEGLSFWQYYHRSRNLRNQINAAQINLQNMINKLNSEKRNLDAFVREIIRIRNMYRNNIDGFLQPALERLIDEIKKKDKEIAQLEKDIEELKASTKKKRKELNNLLEKYPDLKLKTDLAFNEVLPLKKKEFSSANQYYKMLTYQNTELSDQIIGQQNDLTTADRKYITNDSIIPFYNSINFVLLLTYIGIATYVSYLIYYDMITNNRYGKIILILLIVLYPIYMFTLEMQIYDKAKMFNSMVRAEPYNPVE